MSYFADNASQLKINVKQNEDETGLRECQAGAYWAVRGHFTAHHKPALVSLPTGAGKTALMMLVAFGLKAERVLVVTPTDVLREQTREKFYELDGLKVSNTLPDDLEGPEVYKQTSRITSEEEWNELKEYDVVIALPHVISTEYHEDIVAPPDGLFDLVFYDEAHYMRAPSWSKLLNDYEGAKQVLLTATPFRRDKRRVPGELVYFYPLDKAMDMGLYHPVNYDSVTTTPIRRNEDLRNRANEILINERENYPDIKLLIRTDNIEEANQLEGIYQDIDLNVRAVHSKKTARQNEDSIQQLKDGELDGVIGVNSLGEGLDIPFLKIAVFHTPPKSFPFTIQLIGRVARPIAGDVSSYVIADPEQMREKGVEDNVRSLYHEDRGWEKLIPDLVDQVTGQRIESIRPGDSDLILGASIGDLQPYFSTRLYSVEEQNLDFERDIDLGEYIAVYRLPKMQGFDLLGLITEKVDAPSWAKRTGIRIQDFDLNLFYYHSDSETLFECTTSDSISGAIRSQIIEGQEKRLGGKDLVKVMQGSENMNYLSAGLANAVGPTSAIPSYKMFLGKSVQGAVNPSDARTFVRGHLFAKLSEEETRGISDSNGRVWSSNRGNIRQLIEWCSTLGNDLIYNEGVDGPTNFKFFNLPEEIKLFPSKPIFVLPNPELELLNLTVFDSETDTSEELNSIDLSLGNFMPGALRVLRLELNLPGEFESTELKYNIETDSWEADANSIFIKVDDVEVHESIPLDKFFKRYSPWFYLSDGTVVKYGSLYRIKYTYDELPECEVKDLDWSECDIRVEYETDERKPEDGKLSVHDCLQEYIINKLDEEVIIFKDHGSNEVADFITFDIESEEIKFFHCKSAPKKNSGEANIGATLGLVKDVIDQVLRSNMWIKTADLITHISGRNDREIEAEFIQGEDNFISLKDTFVPANWNYKVFIVNPGLDMQQARQTENTNLVLLTCYEWLKGIGADMQIIGSCDN